MYFLNMDTVMGSLHTFWTSLAGSLPTDVTIHLEAAGDVINEVNGELTGAYSFTPLADITGTSSSTYVAPAGAIASWETGTILDGRRLRGRTFVVPIASPNYTTSGSLLSSFVVELQDAAAALISDEADNFVVWHRPFAGRAAVGDRPAKPAHDGGHGVVTSARVPTRAAVLRSRRD